MAQQQRAASINTPLLDDASAVTFSGANGSHRSDSVGDSHAECVLRERGKTLGTKQLGTWFV